MTGIGPELKKGRIVAMRPFLFWRGVFR